jgi:hypothetical protein
MKKLKDFIGNMMNPWFTGMVITAFISFISFIQVNSAWADAHNFNGFFGWLGIGIVFGLTAIFCLYKVVKTSTGEGG